MSTESYLSSTIGPTEVLGIQNGADLHWTDYLVIALYFAGILGVGFWVTIDLNLNSLI